MLVNIFVLLLLMEASARLFLVNHYEEKLAAITSDDIEWGARHLPLNQEDRMAGGFLGKVPHPLFGFSSFQASFENPGLFYEESNSYKFAIFGGSVAQFTAKANQRSGEINNFLQKHLSASKENVEVISFAMEGYRQPQSFSIAATYGHVIDFAVNIEGVNELANFVEGLPPYFPMGFVTNLYFRSLEELSIVPELHKRAIRESQLRAILKNNDFFLQSVRLYFLYERLNNLIQMRPTSEYMADNIQYPFHPPQDWGNSSYDRRFANWLRFSCLQQNVMKGFGVRNLFVVQPIPQSFKTLSEEEASIVSKSREQEMELSEYYSQLNFTDIKKAGLNIIDLRKVFEDQSQTLYIDSCCHFNSSGEKFFIEAIIQELQKEVSLPPTECNLHKLKQALIELK